MSAKTWGLLLSSLVAALTLGIFVASSVAAKEVAPLAERVTRVEAQRAEDRARLERIENKLDMLLQRR